MTTNSAVFALLTVLVCGCNLTSRDEKAAPPPPVFAIAAPASAVASPAALASVATPPASAVTNVKVADAVAGASDVLTDFSTDGLAPLPEDCVAPAVVMLAVPKKNYAADTFDWRHVRQVALANPEYTVVPDLAASKAPKRIAFTENDHKPTGGVALVLHCASSKTCLGFAAAYRATVPTATLTPICGANPSIGARITGGKTVLPASGNILGVLPEKNDVQSQCVRLAACKAARDHRLTSDESQACMMKPSTFKIACAMKKSCDQVLACAGG